MEELSVVPACSASPSMLKTHLGCNAFEFRSYLLPLIGVFVWSEGEGLPVLIFGLFALSGHIPLS